MSRIESDLMQWLAMLLEALRAKHPELAAHANEVAVYRQGSRSFAPTAPFAFSEFSLCGSMRWYWEDWLWWPLHRNATDLTWYVAANTCHNMIVHNRTQCESPLADNNWQQSSNNNGNQYDTRTISHSTGNLCIAKLARQGNDSAPTINLDFLLARAVYEAARRHSPSTLCSLDMRRSSRFQHDVHQGQSLSFNQNIPMQWYCVASEWHAGMHWLLRSVCDYHEFIAVLDDPLLAQRINAPLVCTGAHCRMRPLVDWCGSDHCMHVDCL
jgi:hypothetical protein